MAHDYRKYPAPFSIRLSEEERQRLERAAAGMPLAAYIREKLLCQDVVHRKPRGKNPVKDHRSLAAVLGALGQSRLSNNLNQLAKAAHVGALPVTPEVEDELREACIAIQAMRRDLLAALGVRNEGEEP